MIFKCLKTDGMVERLATLKESGLPVITSEEVLKNMAIEKYGVYNIDFIGLCLRDEELSGLLSRVHHVCHELASRGALVAQYVDITDADDTKALVIGDINPTISDLRVYKYTTTESDGTLREVLAMWRDRLDTLPVVSANITEYLVEENLDSLE